MKKFFKTVAMMMALVMVIDAPVSAAGLGASNTTVEAATVFEGEDKGATIMADGTHAGNDDGTHPGDDEGTHPGNDEGSHSGEDWGTGDGFDQPNQIVSIAIRDDKMINLEKLGERSSKELTADVIVNKLGDYTPDVRWEVTKGTAVEIQGDRKSRTCTIVAKHGGDATVTVTAGHGFGAKSDSVTVHVKEYTTNLKFGESEYTFYLKNKINPMDLIERTPKSANDEITFSVDNSKIATIDKNGFITMKKVTSTPIILTAVTEKGVVATTKINVEEGNPVKKLSLVGDKKVTADYSDSPLKTLTVKVDETKNSGDTTDLFEWTSSKPKVVRVVESESKAKNGEVSTKIEVVGVGKSNVTVKASSGKKATFTVTATAKVKSITITRVDGLNSNIGTTPIPIYPKQKITLLATKDPSINTTKVTTKVAAKALASASWKKQDNTIVVTAKKFKSINEAGEDFTLEVSCDGITKTVNFKLMPSDAASVAITSDVTTLKVGEKVRFGATVKNSKSEVLPSSDMVVWSSSSAKVLSIDADGYATALKAGKAKIKATVYDAKGKAKTAQVQIEVKQPITSMSFKKPTVVLNAGTKKNVSFSVVLGPKGAKAAKNQIFYMAQAYDKYGNEKGVEGLEINTKNQIVVPNSMVAGEYIEVTAVDTQGWIVEAKGKIIIVEKGVKLEADLGKVPTGNGVQGYNKKVLTVAPGTEVNLNDNGVMVQKDSKKAVIENLDQNQFPVTYTFSKKGIVSIDQKGNYGRLFALASGKVKVTAKLAGGAKTTFTIEVKNPSDWSGSQDGSWDGSFGGTGDASLYEKGFRGIKSLKDSRD